MTPRSVVLQTLSCVLWAALFVLHCGTGAAQTPVSATIATLSQPGKPVGVTILVASSTTGIAPDPVLYRFEVASPQGAYRLLKDYSPSNLGEWTPLEEGTYQLKVSVKNGRTGAGASATMAYSVTPLAIAGGVVTPSINPLVALYSAPPCQSGTIRVTFKAEGTTQVQTTPVRLCKPGASSNFYIAGMRKETTYLMQHEITSGGQTVVAPTLSFRTGAVPTDMPVFTVRRPAGLQTSLLDGIALHSVSWSTTQVAYPVATDLLGRPVWLYKRQGGLWTNRANLMRPSGAGTFLMTVNKDNLTGQLLREIDLAGNTLRETNVERLNEQLRQMGQDTIGSLHHEITRLPNGHTLALGSMEKVFNNTQGPGPVTILGDMILDLDENWQVAWIWNSYQSFDLTRTAVLGEVCSGPASGCPSLVGTGPANDWMHSNSIAYSPADGNLLLSMRHQDWVIKIHYANGGGTGAVLWRLGRSGDFSLIGGSGLFPWFSHQHDATVVGNRIVLYDNANTRRLLEPNANSRGQVYLLDETRRTATLELNADLGAYAEAMGSASRLTNGNFFFLSGVLTPGLYSQAIEVTPSGSLNYMLEISSGVYRSFRMKSLYGN